MTVHLVIEAISGDITALAAHLNGHVRIFGLSGGPGLFSLDIAMHVLLADIKGAAQNTLWGLGPNLAPRDRQRC